MPQSKKDVPVRGLNYFLTFGKHKGKTLKQVIEEEPSYIEWCMNERIFVLDEEADELLLDAIEEIDDYYELHQHDFD